MEIEALQPFQIFSIPDQRIDVSLSLVNKIFDELASDEACPSGDEDFHWSNCMGLAGLGQTLLGQNVIVSAKMTMYVKFLDGGLCEPF